MVVIAVLLLAAVVTLTIGAFLIETDAAGFEIFEESFTVSGGTVFAAGLATGLLTVAILVMLRIGVRRSIARRREIRELREAHKRTVALEKDREARETDEEQGRRETLVRPYVGQSDRPSSGDRPSSSTAEARSPDAGRPPGPSPSARPPTSGSGLGPSARFDPGPRPGPAGPRRSAR